MPAFVHALANFDEETRCKGVAFVNRVLQAILAQRRRNSNGGADTGKEIGRLIPVKRANDLAFPGRMIVAFSLPPSCSKTRKDWKFCVTFETLQRVLASFSHLSLSVLKMEAHRKRLHCYTCEFPLRGESERAGLATKA